MTTDQEEDKDANSEENVPREQEDDFKSLSHSDLCKKCDMLRRGTHSALRKIQKISEKTSQLQDENTQLRQQVRELEKVSKLLSDKCVLLEKDQNMSGMGSKISANLKNDELLRKYEEELSQVKSERQTIEKNHSFLKIQYDEVVKTIEILKNEYECNFKRAREKFSDTLKSYERKISNLQKNSDLFQAQRDNFEKLYKENEKVLQNKIDTYTKERTEHTLVISTQEKDIRDIKAQLKSVNENLIRERLLIFGQLFDLKFNVEMISQNGKTTPGTLSISTDLHLILQFGKQLYTSILSEVEIDIDKTNNYMIILMGTEPRYLLNLSSFHSQLIQMLITYYQLKS